MPQLVRKNVALLIESSRSYGRDLLRGVALYSRTRGNWSLLHEEMTIDAKLPTWLGEFEVQGVIARLDDHLVRPLKRLGVPVIDVRCRRSYPGVPQVETDDRAVAALALEHLWQRGFRRFAFCGFRGAHFSENRLKYFRDFVAERQCPLSVYETDGEGSAPLTSIERAGVLDVKHLTNWLSELTPPTGLFVCNDIRGQQVLNACRLLNLSVPEDLGVIGVDDDDTICPLSDPPLSSVSPDAERVGFQAAETLDGMMHGESEVPDIRYVPPQGVTQRLSTQVVAIDDREVAKACRFIRENACNGIDVSDVVSFTDLSRRQLERRFRIELGRTPHEELTAAQIGRVKQLLLDTDLTLEQLAPLAGYSHKERLSAVFKRETGQTPGQYRHQRKPDPKST